MCSKKEHIFILNITTKIFHLVGQKVTTHLVLAMVTSHDSP